MGLLDTFAMKEINFDFDDLSRASTLKSQTLSESMFNMLGFSTLDVEDEKNEMVTNLNQHVDSKIITYLREPVFSEVPVEEWEKKKALIELEMETKEHRDNIALFFETLSQKKDANYRVSKVKFENIANLVEFLVQTCENYNDLANAAVLLYYTQYFCYADEDLKRFVFMGERLQELPLAKNEDFWIKAFVAMIYVDILNSRTKCWYPKELKGGVFSLISISATTDHFIISSLLKRFKR